MSSKLEKQKTKLSKDVLIRKTCKIEHLSNSIQLTREIEVNFETIMQILLLAGLTCFYRYMFEAPSGQTYSYFFGVAYLVVRGNFVLFSASLSLSFLGPCCFFVNRTNFLRRGSLNLGRKLVLMIRNVLFLLVRVLAITSSIFIPVINSWDMFIRNKGIDATSVLGYWGFHIEFQKHFRKGLDTLTADIRGNALIFGLLFVIHLFLVAIHGIFCSAKFGKGSVKEKVIFLISSFSLPLPFCLTSSFLAMCIFSLQTSLSSAGMS